MPFLFVSHSSLNKILAIRHTLFIGSYYRNLTYFTIYAPLFAAGMPRPLPGPGISELPGRPKFCATEFY
jgi:hypothetical protein